MAGVVEKVSTWREIEARDSRPAIRLLLSKNGDLAVIPVVRGHGFVGDLTISAEDLPGFSAWLQAKLPPDASIWNRLAAHSAVKTEGA